MIEVWQCGSWAVDCSSVYFLVADESAALEWLEAKRAEQERVALAANERSGIRLRLEWPVPRKLESMVGEHWFETLNDTYYVRRVPVHTKVPEQYRP